MTTGSTRAEHHPLIRRNVRTTPANHLTTDSTRYASRLTRPPTVRAPCSRRARTRFAAHPPAVRRGRGSSVSADQWAGCSDALRNADAGRSPHRSRQPRRGAVPEPPAHRLADPPRKPRDARSRSCNRARDAARHACHNLLRSSTVQGKFRRAQPGRFHFNLACASRGRAVLPRHRVRRRHAQHGHRTAQHCRAGGRAQRGSAFGMSLTARISGNDLRAREGVTLIQPHA